VHLSTRFLLASTQVTSKFFFGGVFGLHRIYEEAFMPLILVSPYRKIVAAIQSITGFLNAWGFNNSNAVLGKGTVASTNDDLVPNGILTNSRWLQVATHTNHSLAIRADGTLWAWGANASGQCGTGNTSGTNAGSNVIVTPVQIGTDTDWAWVSVGVEHSAAIKKDGTLWTWGYNNLGQLGKGHATIIGSNYAPAKIGTATDWKEVHCSYHGNVALKTDGTIWTWGFNYSGMLGQGTTQYVPQHYSPFQLPGEWISVGARYGHMAAVRKDGTIWTWGNNSDGQLGTNDTNNRLSPTQVQTGTDWKKIYVGFFNNFAIKNDGTIWSWGRNGYGELGKGANSSSMNNYIPVQVPNFVNPLLIAPGQSFTGLIAEDGRMYTVGLNGNGQLGTGDKVNSATFKNVGTFAKWLNLVCGWMHSFGMPEFYATWNPLDKDAGMTLSNGNLNTSSGGGNGVRSTISKTTGKWYYEAKVTAAPGNSVIVFGIADKNLGLNWFWNTSPAASKRYYVGMYSAQASRYFDGTQDVMIPGNITIAANDVIGVAFDLDNKKIEFFKNGVKIGEANSIVAGIQYYAFTSDGSSGSVQQATTNFGATPFVYPIPQGYKAFGSE
jgi:alpha-tubulin suppressor-like RCC1 family protein